jgi:hypothetical protein
MFIQVIQGKVKDADHLRGELQRWRTELKPGARGYLGSTGGVAPDGRGITLVRFDSEEAARANSDRPEQGAWWNEAVKAFDGEVTFHECRDVDSALGGGSNDAGFVQVVQGRAKDQEAMRRRLPELEQQLHERRPDILGIVLGWHVDGGFTQAVYFTSAESARQGEASTENDELRQEFMSLLDGQPTFFDIATPDLD